jgi:broad specificity phosphatase PhoE
MNKTYYILRHGETVVTQSKGKKKWYGLRHFSAPILPIGIPVTKSIASYLKNKSIDYFVCSEYLRCRQTAKIVSEVIKKDFVCDQRLNDYFIETFWHFRRRLQSFLADMDKLPYESIAVCTHGFTIAGLTQFLTKGTFSFSEMFNYPSPEELTIVKKQTKEVINFNGNEYDPSGTRIELRG